MRPVFVYPDRLQPGDVVLPSTRWSANPPRVVVSVEMKRSSYRVQFEPVAGLPTVILAEPDHLFPVEVKEW